MITAALSALSYGIADFSGGLAARKSPVSAVAAWSQAVGILIALLAVPLVGGSSPNLHTWLWGAAAGISGSAGLGFLYRGLSEGRAVIVSPTAALTGAALPVLFGVISGERPDLITWSGVAIALPAILLLSFERGEQRNAVLGSLRTGLIAGVGFSGFFILLSKTEAGSGLWPLVAARSASVPFLFLMTIIRRKPLLLNRGSRRATLSAGILDMLANIFYLMAARSGMLITAVVVTAMYPAPTVILQRIVFKENISALRIAGLLMALAGIALIGMG
jgi:drug/metabolite transporter (DMT)-like permease